MDGWVDDQTSNHPKRIYQKKYYSYLNMCFANNKSLLFLLSDAFFAECSIFVFEFGGFD